MLIQSLQEDSDFNQFQQDSSAEYGKVRQNPQAKTALDGLNPQNRGVRLKIQLAEKRQRGFLIACVRRPKFQQSNRQASDRTAAAEIRVAYRCWSGVRSAPGSLKYRLIREDLFPFRPGSHGTLSGYFWASLFSVY